MRTSTSCAFGAALLLALVHRTARADDVLHVGAPELDPPTVVSLGVRLIVQGDDNHNAAVTVRYRPAGASTWRTGLPLYRVRPEVVVGRTVAPHFAGSIFDLLPGTSYEIELHATDADGSVDQVVALSATTRPVPASDPRTPRPKSVATAAALTAALSAAAAGDVITIAAGTYSGTFAIQASGTADNPIVIRGASEEGTILDGAGCTGCNILEVYGSFVHVEKLTLAHASRALRFQGDGAEANVVRRVHVKDTILGIGSKPNQKDFYLCDNILEGRLVWPAVYTDDGGLHANDDGIHVEGNGHVVCHNKLVGFGDALKTEQDGARALDFYGNDVLSAYDNGIELDGSEGNVRCFRNRFTNTYATLSYQPIFGGPAYTMRNVIVNVANEQMKFHALGTVPPEEPSGVFVYHNTFVSPKNALANHTDAVSHHFAIENNLFVSAVDPTGRTVDWTGVVDDGTFDYNGYFPDGIFDFTWGASGYVKFTSLQAARAAIGIETHGILLAPPIFASGLVAPAAYTVTLAPADVALATGSNAIDKGLVLPNINDGFTGSAPDLGALEIGCEAPVFGVRPDGVDETNAPVGCRGVAPDGGVEAGAAGTAGTGGAAGTAGTGGAAGTAGTGGATPAGGSSGNVAAAPPAESSGGCGCRSAPSGGASTWAVALWAIAFACGRRRRRDPRS